MREDYTIEELCEALEISRSGYYRSRQRQPSLRQKQNQQIIEEMQSIHEEDFLSSYGSPRMTTELQQRGFSCSENRVARLMAQSGIQAQAPKAFRPRTTVADPSRKPAPNRLKDEPEPDAPGQILISDITYVATAEGWLYLAVIIDLFSRAVVGWKLADHLQTSLVLDALKGATRAHLAGSGTLFHSDRGCQYTSGSFRNTLNHLGMVQSMSATGYCYDNAACESFFASIKREAFPENSTFETKAQARSVIFKYLETFYNRRRRHSSLGNLSPDQFLQNHFQSLNPTLN